jgi:hypothetical protein
MRLARVLLLAALGPGCGSQPGSDGDLPERVAAARRWMVVGDHGALSLVLFDRLLEPRVTALSSPGSGAGDPRFSADGEQVAFLASAPDGHSEIQGASLGPGREPVRAWPLPLGRWDSNRRPALHWLGSRSLLVETLAGASSLERLEPADGRTTALGTGGPPVFSRNSRAALAAREDALLYVHELGEESIAVRPAQLSPGLAPRITVSPDGQHIALVAAPPPPDAHASAVTVHRIAWQSAGAPPCNQPPEQCPTAPRPAELAGVAWSPDGKTMVVEEQVFRGSGAREEVLGTLHVTGEKDLFIGGAGPTPPFPAGEKVAFGGMHVFPGMNWGFAGTDVLYWADLGTRQASGQEELVSSRIFAARTGALGAPKLLATFAAQATIWLVPAPDGSTLFASANRVAGDPSKPSFIGFALHAIAMDPGGPASSVLLAQGTDERWIYLLEPQPRGRGLLFAIAARTCTQEPIRCDTCAPCSGPIDHVLVRDPRDPASAHPLPGLTAVTWAPDGSGVLALDHGRAVYVPLEAPDQRYPLAPATALFLPSRWPER